MFVKDINTKSIINTDDSVYKMILAKRETDRLNRHLQEQLHNIGNDFTDIRAQLKELINNK